MTRFKIFKIKTILLIILIKNRILKKIKFIKVLHTPKINYNLILNRRLHTYKYYFYGDDNIIQYIDDNSKLAFIPFIEKGLYKLFLAEPGVYYISRNTPANIKI